MRRPVRLRLAVALATVIVGLVGAAAASADSTDSSNWAGYAIHHTGVRYRTVVGSWTQPHATCTAGSSTYSSVWVGLGGYSANSTALEQIGTELDCTASGRVESDAWYELVPAASHTTRLSVSPGDRMRASVTVTGTTVTLTIANLTSGRSFTRTLHDTVLDVTSAEWIVEAPSLCASGATECETLPLANFGTAAINGAHATTTTGYTGSISNRRWTTTKISLASAGGAFVGTSSAREVLASPSALSSNGRAFTVRYSGTSTGGVTSADVAARSLPRRVVHLGR
jgi:hypothetical protein